MTERSYVRTIVDAEGVPVAQCVEIGRLGPPRVEFLRPLRGPAAAVGPVMHELAGFRCSCVDADLSAALVAAGAKQLRTFSFMSIDLQQTPKLWTDTPLPDGVAVRPLTESDVDELTELELRAFPPGHVDHHSDDENTVRQSNFERITDPARPLMPHALLALHGAAAVGVVTTQFVGRIPGMEGPWLTNVARDPDTRWAGLGAAMISSVLTALRHDGYAQAFLAVTDGNPARRVYERVGFVDFTRASFLALSPADRSSVEV
jgi:GNAT superfamily N-acetyltransferase